jgi:hypothetical protein
VGGARVVELQLQDALLALLRLETEVRLRLVFLQVQNVVSDRLLRTATSRDM